MLRVVLDANVLASAFIQPLGPSGQILRRFLEERAFELVTSVEILAELRRCLGYPRVRKHLRWTGDEVDRRLTSLGVLADVVAGQVKVQAVKSDPDDDKYVAAALEGQASLIVSGDRHLLDLKDYQGVRILRPREFWEILKAMLAPPKRLRGPGEEKRGPSPSS